MKDLPMKNLLTFTTASGSTQLRGYVKVAFGLFVILVALFGVNAYNRNQMVTEVMATPRPLDPGQMPIPTEKIVALDPSMEACPSNPADWTLTGNVSVPGSNLKGLSPQCVRDQLDKTAAWFYATTHLGYTRTEAAAILGLQNPVIVFLPDALITVLTDYKNDPQQVPLSTSVPNLDFAEWRVNANGKVESSFTFSGCFRTSSVSGGEVVNWGNGYPIVCQFFADYQTEYVVSSINGHVATLLSGFSVRRPMWFGYSGAGNWAWLGSAKGWDVDLSQIPSRGTVVIDESIMVDKYGITAIPMPQDWKTFTDQEHINAVVMALNGEQ